MKYRNHVFSSVGLNMEKIMMHFSLCTQQGHVYYLKCLFSCVSLYVPALAKPSHFSTTVSALMDINLLKTLLLCHQINKKLRRTFWQIIH